jgi:hypothetical protein
LILVLFLQVRGCNIVEGTLSIYFCSQNPTSSPLLAVFCIEGLGLFPHFASIEVRMLIHKKSKLTLQVRMLPHKVLRLFFVFYKSTKHLFICFAFVGILLGGFWKWFIFKGLGIMKWEIGIMQEIVLSL